MVWSKALSHAPWEIFHIFALDAPPVYAIMVGWMDGRPTPCRRCAFPSGKQSIHRSWQG